MTRTDCIDTQTYNHSQKEYITNKMDADSLIGKWQVLHGDSLELIDNLDDESIDIIVTSPPYWGQRTSLGNGTEEDPKQYLNNIVSILSKSLRVLKPEGMLWLNIGDSYNGLTPS